MYRIAGSGSVFFCRYINFIYVNVRGVHINKAVIDCYPSNRNCIRPVGGRCVSPWPKALMNEIKPATLLFALLSKISHSLLRNCEDTPF